MARLRFMGALGVIAGLGACGPFACGGPPVSGPVPPSVYDTTIAGADSDNDGIRDDVAAFIDRTYRDAPQAIPHLRAMAADTQAAITLDFSTPAAGDQAQQIAEELGRTSTCLIGRVQDPAAAARALHAEVVNNGMRGEAYDQFDTLVSGASVVAPTAEERAAYCAGEGARR